MTAADLLSRVARARADFPALAEPVHGRPLVYLDSAATALAPTAVIEAIADYYRRDAGSPHRAVHERARRAGAALERARARVGKFVGGAPDEVVFVRGVTEAINLVAQAWARPRLAAGDEVVVTALEHHSNLVPWQIACEQTGARLVVVDIDESGAVSTDAFARAVGSGRCRVAALAHVSNALGTVLPVAELCRAAREAGAVTVIDGAQAVAHAPVDVGALGCDFYAFSGHKLYGPTGIGALWGRREVFGKTAPYHGGGHMIARVERERSSYADPPGRFEAGTPNVAGAVGLAAAIEYLVGWGWDAIGAHERDVLAHAERVLSAIPGLRRIGTAEPRLGVISFVLAGVHPHDIGTIADAEGVAIRTGHHCAQLVMDRFGVEATARASIGLYSTRGDIDALARALARVREVFG